MADISKVILEALVNQLRNPEGSLLLSRLQSLMHLDPAQQALVKDLGQEESSNKHSVGIWEVHGIGTKRILVRKDNTKNQWRDWANFEQIEILPNVKRIVLLGESVARGYLLDPVVNPACLLQMLLDKDDNTAYQVIDLACTDSSLEYLITISHQLKELRPDYVVLFAGNNWHKFQLDSIDFQVLAQELRLGQSFGAMAGAFRNNIMPGKIKRALDVLTQACAALGAQQLVVIPEFNLLDWKSEEEVLVPFLPNQSRKDWLSQRDSALARFERGSEFELQRIAKEMAKADGGASWLAPWLEGIALSRGIESLTARAALEMARDAVCGLFVPHSPRCITQTRQILLEYASSCSLGGIDLAVEFENASGASLPGRNWFLDYCHLNVDGMRLTATRMAESILSLERGSIAAQKEQLRSILPISETIEAEAHFLAAIHNAHYGQGAEIVEYHARKSFELDSGVAQLAQAFIDFQSSGGPAWMFESYRFLSSFRMASKYMWPTNSSMVDKFQDSSLIEIFVDLIELQDPTIRQNVTAKLVAAHSERLGAIDLLEHFAHAKTFRAKLGYAMEASYPFYRAHTPVSEFRFIATREVPLVGRLCLRLPIDQTAGCWPLSIAVNGRPIFTKDFGSDWQTVLVDIAIEQLCYGENFLTISWPVQIGDDNSAINEAIRSLELGFVPRVLPTYGDVFSFRLYPVEAMPS